MTSQPNREWIADKLAVVTEHADALIEVNPDVTNEYRPLTALKLIVLSAGVEMYSRIVPGRYDHNYYLDLFAGAGATQIRGTDHAVVGSPILAPVMAHEHFEEYHFVDVESEKASALEARLDYIDNEIDFPRDKCYVHCADANEFAHDFLDGVRDEIGPAYNGFNMFSFLDPEGLDPKWHVVRRIADLYGDLLIHYPESVASRDLGTKKAQSYFPSAEFKQCPSEQAREEFYCEELGQCDHTDITIPIRIDSGSSGGNFHYDLIYATRNTSNGAPYAKAMEHMQGKVNSLDGDDIKRVFRGLKGDETALSQFIGSSDETEKSDSSPGGSQGNLADFI